MSDSTSAPTTTTATATATAGAGSGSGSGSTAASLYKPIPLHFKIPHGIFVHEATSLAKDNESDDIFVFCRGNVPVLRFNPDGDLVSFWGNKTPWDGVEEVVKDVYGGKMVRWRGSEFIRAHGAHVDAEGFVWLVDDLGHAVIKCDKDGKRVMMLLPFNRVLTDEAEMAEATGKVPAAPPSQSQQTFNRPTHVAVHPVSREVYVSDGYGNSRIHVFSPEGVHLRSWGEPGTDEGQFNFPHNICFHPDLEHVLIADRENCRIQMHTLKGEYVRSIRAFRPSTVTCGVGPGGEPDCIFIGEMATISAFHQGEGFTALDTWTSNVGNRVLVHRSSGDYDRLATLGAEKPGERPDSFLYIHSVAVTSSGSVYVAEVSWTECGRFHPIAREMVSLRKWVPTV